MEKYNYKIKELVGGLASACGTNIAQIASKMMRNGKKLTRQALWREIRNGTLRASTFLEVLDVLGIELKFLKDGKEISFEQEQGEE